MACFVDVHALRAVSNVNSVDALSLCGTSAPPKPSGLANFTGTLLLLLEAFREANEMRRRAHLVRRIDSE